MKNNNLKKLLLLSMIAFTLNKKNVSAKELNDYLTDQINYYKENPDKIDYDLNEKITIDNRGNEYKADLYYSVSNLDNKLGDFVYVWGIGNANSFGTGESVKNLNYDEEYIPRVIVGVKSQNEYPYAIANYDEETKTTGEIIGWFKDSNVSTRIIHNYNVIESPIVSYLKFNDNADETYTKLNDKVSIKIDYSIQKLPNGFFMKDGYYVDKSSETIIRQTLSDKQIKKLSKYKIKNN